MSGTVLRDDASLAAGDTGRGEGAGQFLARTELRRQIGRLEGELARLTFDAFGRVVVPYRVAAAGGPRILDLGELERLRDELAERTGEAREVLAGRAAVEDANRELLRRMIDSPGEHRWLRISRADLGEPGCGHWHSRPRLGPLGMLMGWWQVVVSSGCPRAGRLAAATAQSGSHGPTGAIELFVAGAHLSGQSLNHQLTDRGRGWSERRGPRRSIGSSRSTPCRRSPGWSASPRAGPRCQARSGRCPP